MDFLTGVGSSHGGQRSLRQPLIDDAADESFVVMGASRPATVDVEEQASLRRQTYADQLFEDELAQQQQRGEEEEEELNPPFKDDERRQMTPAGGVFTLMASMLGGAMLTLPFATARIGIGLSLLISLLSALASESTYFFLVQAARDTRANTYHSIGQAYLGRGGKVVSMVSLVCLCLFASAGYLLLLGLLVGEIATHDGSAPPRRLKNIISVLFAAFLAPLSASKSLHALRYSNMMSVIAAVLLLTSVLVESARQGKGFYPSKRLDDESIKWYTTDFKDIMYAVPFFVGAYMAHFSLLSVHAELVQPTKARVRGVIRVTIFSAWVLYSVIGVLGYMYALDKTCDSIFSNLPKDVLTVFGRIGLSATLAFSYPLFIVPCRVTLRDLFLSWRGVEEEAARGDGDRGRLEWEAWFDTDTVRRTLTVAIVLVSTTVACILPSVALFVSLVGATVGAILALLLPSIFYLKMSSWRQTLGYKVLSVFLIAVALFVMVGGTWTSVSHAMDDPCEEQQVG